MWLVAAKREPGLLKIEYIIYTADDKIAVGGGGVSIGRGSNTELIKNTLLPLPRRESKISNTKLMDYDLKKNS